MTLHLTDLDIANNEPFDGVHLLKAKDLEASVNLPSLFSDQIEVNQIKILEPIVDIRVLPDGRANYDIAIVEENPAEQAEPTTSEESAFNMALSKYVIENGTVNYVDETFPMAIHAESLNHSGSGDFTASVFDLQTVTKADHITFVYDDIPYLNQAKLEADAGFGIDLDQSKYTFRENEIKVNDFGMHADGFVALPEENIEMDVAFEANQNDFKSLMSLIPAEFAQDLEGTKAEGTVSFDGYVKGMYSESVLPGLVLNLVIEDGMLQYPDLPENIKNVQLDAHLNAKNGIMEDDLLLDINTFHVEMAGSPVDLTFGLRTPYSDPEINGNLIAKVVLENLKNAIPLEASDVLSGIINADVQMKGNYSAIEAKRYQDFEAAGQIIVQELLYQSDSLDYDIDINRAYLNFSPQAMA
ncbi:MAG: AsmA family protein, partial [Bacteroidota bacterium]